MNPGLGKFGLLVMLLASSARAQVDVVFTRGDGTPLTAVSRKELIRPVELRLYNRGPQPVTLSAFEFRFSGGDFGNQSFCATHWQLDAALNALNPAWVTPDGSLNSCGGDERVAGVSGSLSPPFTGPALPPGQSVRIGTFDLSVDHGTPGAKLNLMLDVGSAFDDHVGSLGGGGFRVLGQQVTVEFGLTLNVALRVIRAGDAGPQTGAPPANVDEVCSGETLLAEIWATQVDGGNEGVGSLSVGLRYDPATLTAAPPVQYAALFAAKSNDPTIDPVAGLVGGVSSTASTGGQGVSPEWVLLARVPFVAVGGGLTTVLFDGSGGSFALSGGSAPLRVGAEVVLGEPVSFGVTDGGIADCNENGIPDGCDLAEGTDSDCNANGALDTCDLSSGTSDDCNEDDRPDDCGALGVCELAKLDASDQGTDDRFGTSVAVSGDYAIIGARLDNCAPSGSNCGSAYIFKRDHGRWTQVQRLSASDAKAEDLFGFSVSMDADVAVVGARTADCGPGALDCGAAYVFTRGENGSWTESQKLSGHSPAPGDNVGAAVAVDGDVIVVGAPFAACANQGAGCGEAHVFHRGGGAWSFVTTLSPVSSAAGDNFGQSVTADGNVIAVGVPGASCAGGSGCGAVDVFQRNSGAWTALPRLTAVDAGAGDRLGVDVDVERDLMVAGANEDACPGGAQKCGSSYVFRHRAGAWRFDGKLHAADGAALDSFGTEVATNGEAILVGSRLDDCANGTLNCGSAYVFRRLDGAWSQTARLTASDGDEGDLFGVAVALSEGTALIGAYDDDCRNGTVMCGSAYMYAISGEDCDCDGAVDACQLQTTDFDRDGLLDGCDVDQDGDGVPNDADACDFTPPGLPSHDGGMHIGLPGQVCLLDWAEFEAFAACLSSAGPGAAAANDACARYFDYNRDGRNDLKDVASAQRLFTLPESPE